jgi:hypothetical protein
MRPRENMRSNRTFPRWVKLELELLEPREAPSVTPWITDTFEGINVSPPGSPPTLPLNWSQWSSDPNTQFTVTASPSPTLGSSRSLSVSSGTNGVNGAVTRTWLDETMPADVEVSAAVYVDSPIPAQVIARGSNLNMPDSDNGGPSFYAVELSSDSPGPLLAIVKDVNGTETTLASINAPNSVSDSWLEETLDVEGATVRAQLFDPTTGEYLNSSGQWQTSQAWALTVIDNSITGPGFVGLGRPASDTGTVSFDDFSVQAPSTVQSFDATPVGSLPDNWSSYDTNSDDIVAVADPSNPTAYSGTNALAITAANSGDTARAWLNTTLPADLSVSAYTYLDTLTPAQVFARGSDLDTDTPSYYAVEVTRGYLTASLVKVVNGQQTVLGSVTSTAYVGNVWVQETLGLSGDTLEAQIYRTDTDQYLNSDGTWQSTPTWAVTATDSSLTSGGQAGVGRPVVQEYMETDYFDDFTTATGMDTQDFDNTSAGSMPSGWSQYSSNGDNNYFSVATNPSTSSFLSASNVLASGEMSSSLTAAAWDTNTNDVLTNAQVTMGEYVATVMPTLQLIARGSNLNTTDPSYYGLSVLGGESGPTVDLVRMNDGEETTLAQLQAYNYVNTWVQETLYVDGDNVRASIYRPDTGQYLSSDGQWQTLPTYAINVIDPDPLIQAGEAGIVRPSGSAGYAGYVDNFAVEPLSVDSTPPSVTVSVPSGTLTGDVAVTATATQTVPTSAYAIAQVAFYVDGVLSWVATTPTSGSQYTWDFDTSSVSNGTHTLLVEIYDDEGNIGSYQTTITTSNNTTLSMPSDFPPYQNSSVGITELAYKGTEPNPYNDTLLQNNVDVVVSDPAFVSGIESAAPNVQQLLYTNVSNIAVTGSILDASDLSQDALLSWLNYAETNTINAEDAFYHVAVATPYSGGSPNSTEPVDEFWAVYGPSGTNDYYDAYNGGSLQLGNSVNQAIDIGYPEQFWEINFDLTSGGSGGWSYVLQYPTAVDSSGNPTSWATLTPLSDTTDGLTQAGQGQMTFNVPSNWVPASIDGSATMYYVRILTETAGTAPVADTIKGENYTQSPAGSDTSGIIPAYDWALDPSGGYLDPTEYAIAAAAGYTAHFGYQSRLFFDGSMRFYTNPSNPEFDAWALTYYPSLVANTPYNGLFVDNSNGDPPGNSNIEKYNIAGNSSTYKIDLVEPIDSYSTDYATLLNEIAQDLAPDNGWIMANTSGAVNVPGGQLGQTSADPVISKVQAYYEEQGLRAASDDTASFLSLYEKVYYRATNDNPSYAVIDSTSSGGSETDGQTQLTTLAAYYILAPNNPSQGALDFFGGEAPSTYWVVPDTDPAEYQHWSPAAAYNIGTPEISLPAPSQIPEIASGTESDGSTYVVYDRQFTGSNGQPVLVLYKPISVLPDGGASTLTSSASATTITLPGSYYVLQANGTLTITAQTTISLSNGEGAILVEAGTDGPDIAGASTVAASGPTNGAAVALSSTHSASGSSVSQGSPGPLPSELLAAESLERLLPGLFTPNTAGAGQASMALPAEERNASAELGEFLSLPAVENMTASLAAGNGPTTNWPTEGSQAPLTVSAPPASLWLGSLRPSKASNNSSSDESTSPADNAVAGSPVDDPVAPSSAS